MTGWRMAILASNLQLDPDLKKEIEAAGYHGFIESQTSNNWAWPLILNLLPIVMFVGLMYFLFRQQIRMAGKSAFSFGKSKAKILTLAGGSFTVTAGQLKTITLHLSASARALLARTHVVSARVTIVAHGPSGLTHTTTVNLTLRPAKRAKHH